MANYSRLRYPLFFGGLFLIEIGGLLFHFLSGSHSFSVYDVVPFAVVGFVIYLASLFVPRA
ncbi:MAG: hypothetical protein QW812_03850 [Thermoplasmataceae archaeon]